MSFRHIHVIIKSSTWFLSFCTCSLVKNSHLHLSFQSFSLNTPQIHKLCHIGRLIVRIYGLHLIRSGSSALHPHLMSELVCCAEWCAVCQWENTVYIIKCRVNAVKVHSLWIYLTILIMWCMFIFCPHHRIYWPLCVMCDMFLDYKKLLGADIYSR